FVDFQRVIVKELLAGFDVAYRIDENAVVFLSRFAVWIAAMVDPARVVASNLWIDNFAVFQAKVECMWVILVVWSGFPGYPFAGVLDYASAFGSEPHGVNAAPVHAGLADRDSCGSLSTFEFLRHGEN